MSSAIGPLNLVDLTSCLALCYNHWHGLAEMHTTTHDVILINNIVIIGIITLIVYWCICTALYTEFY